MRTETTFIDKYYLCIRWLATLNEKVHLDGSYVEIFITRADDEAIDVYDTLDLSEKSMLDAVV